MRKNGAVDEGEVLVRARCLGGRRVAEVALYFGVDLPADGRRAKGFVGQLLDRALASQRGAGPDFPHLGVELKTLPVRADGRVAESTFVCGLDARGAAEASWAGSRVRAKLARVLWVAVEAGVPLAERRFGAAWLWSPSPADEAALRHDYEELTGRWARGEPSDGSAGRWLQLRPKGATAAARARAVDAEGAPCLRPRRAWYLRARYTERLLAEEGFATCP